MCGVEVSLSILIWGKAVIRKTVQVPVLWCRYDSVTYIPTQSEPALMAVSVSDPNQRTVMLVMMLKYATAYFLTCYLLPESYDSVCHSYRPYKL